MISNPKHPGIPTQTGTILEKDSGASPGSRAKLPWTAPRWRRLDLEGTDGKFSLFFETQTTFGIPLGPS
jgi:hypothetical protein